MGAVKNITRRTFLVASTAIAGGVAFGTYQYQKPTPNPLMADGESDDSEVSLNPYLKIDQIGVTVITPKAEMGQGVHSMFAMLVAEELDLDWKTIKTDHGPASNVYYNSALLRAMSGFHEYNQSQTANRVRGFTEVGAKFLGMQITGGSTSAPDGFVKLRRAGASARIALTLAAANQWGVPATSLKTENGHVINPASGDRLSYSELAVAAVDIKAPSKPPLRDPSQWRYIGKSMPRLDIPAKTTGKARFASDIQLPDMLYATVKMSPRFGAGIKNADTSKAESMPGVEQVIKLDNAGFAVIANNTWRALKAADAIEVEWEDAAYPLDNVALMQQYAATFDAEPHGTFTEEGNVELAFADACEIIDVEYRVPHLAHATMEPMSIVGQIKDDRIDLWAGSQSPTTFRDVMAKLAGIDKNKIHIHTTLLGGGFGRRAENDSVEQAYRIASATSGRPVKICWSREEDMRHDFYRPAAIARMKGVMADSKPLAMDAQIASPSIMDYRAKHSDSPALSKDPLIVEGTAGQPDQNCPATCDCILNPFRRWNTYKISLRYSAMDIERWRPEQVWIYRRPVDMRKSIDGLCAIVSMELDRNPADRSIYVFCNRAKDKIKLLIWHRNGFWMLYKRLDKQRFHWPDWFSDESLSLSVERLDQLLDGYNLNGMRPHRTITTAHII